MLTGWNTQCHDTWLYLYNSCTYTLHTQVPPLKAKTTCNFIYGSQSATLNKHNSQGIPTAPSLYGQFAAGIHLPFSSHSTPSVITKMDPYSPAQCQKQKERYVKADIPSYRTPAQRCNKSAYTRRWYTYKPPPLFMRSWQETLWNTICSIYWSSYKSLS